MSVNVGPCGWTHPSDMTRRVDRFNPDAPVAYVGRSGGPTFPTRAEAEAHECATQHQTTEESR